MRHGLYLHPWDLDHFLSQHGSLQPLRELGITDIALPSSYHAGRWTTPYGDQGLVRFLEDGCCHLRVEPGEGPLQAEMASTVPADGPDPLDRAIEAATAADLEVHAWTVFCHNSRLGRLHPELCCQNAFGDVYEYSLCPSRPEVQAYVLHLARSLAAKPGLHTLEIEALGFMGYKHGSHHNKSSFSPDTWMDVLLSTCFCSGCTAGIAAQGVDADALRARIRQLLHQAICETDAMQPHQRNRAQSEAALAEDLGEDGLQALLQHRRQLYQQLLQAIRQAVRPDLRLSAHVRLDPLFSGSQLGLPAAELAPHLDSLLSTHYGEGPDKIAAAWRDQDTAGADCRLCFWPKAPEFQGVADLDPLLDLCRERQLSGLRVYHLGLLPWTTTQACLSHLQQRS